MAWKLWCVFALVCFSSAQIWAEEHRENFFHHVRSQRQLHDFDYNGDDTDNGKCPAVKFPPFLGHSCDVTEYCSKITCNTLVHAKHWTIIFQVNRCEEPVTAQVAVKSREFRVDWSHTFKDGEEIGIPWKPGFVADQLPAAFMKMVQITKLALRVGLKKEGDKLDFKLELLGEGKVLKELTRHFDVTFLKGEAPLNTDHCGYKAWFKKQPVYMKALLIVGSAAVLLMLIVVTLCCCKSDRRRREPTRLSVQLPSHRPPIASTRRKVPMMPLINEE